MNEGSLGGWRAGVVVDLRLPKNSAVCTRAGEMLLAQHSPALALGAVEKALLVDPKDLPAQRLRVKL